MDISVSTLLGFGTYGILAGIIVVIIRGYLRWHQRFVQFREAFKETLREVNRAAHQENWSHAVLLLHRKYDSHLAIMQLFTDEQKQLIINEIYRIQSACANKDKEKVTHLTCSLSAGFDVFCYQPFRQMFLCPTEFLKTLFMVKRERL